MVEVAATIVANPFAIFGEAHSFITIVAIVGVVAAVVAVAFVIVGGAHSLVGFVFLDVFGVQFVSALVHAKQELVLHTVSMSTVLPSANSE